MNDFYMKVTFFMNQKSYTTFLERYIIFIVINTIKMRK